MDWRKIKAVNNGRKRLIPMNIPAGIAPYIIILSITTQPPTMTAQ
jgi:hypothetical protein